MSQYPTYQFEPSQYEVSPEVLVSYEEHALKTGSDELFGELYDLQLIFLCDISGSMKEKDTDPEGKSTRGMLGPHWTRYDNMVKLLKTFVTELFSFDKNGEIPCYFFNKQVFSETFKDPMKLVAAARGHRPSSTTNLAGALRKAAADNLNDKEKFLFIVFTDGVPDSTEEVDKFIESEIYKKDPKGDRINLLLVRFGDDAGAIKYLQYLDDHPVYGDSVDTKSDNAAYWLGPKNLVINALYEQIEKIPEYAAKLETMQ